MNLQTRIDLERRIVRRVVGDLLAAGYEVAVDNGHDRIPCNRNYTRSAHLLVRKDDHASFVYLVYGNNGYDLICDYSVSLEPVMEPINAWIDAQEAE